MADRVVTNSPSLHRRRAGFAGAVLTQGGPGPTTPEPSEPPVATPEPSEWVRAWNELGVGLQLAVVIGGAVVLYVAFRWILLRKLERWSDATSNDLDDRLVQFTKQFFGIAVVVAAFGGVLAILGFEITPLLAGAGIVGVALGFAAKETIADVLAGIFLIADRPMRIGDRVKVEHIGRDWGGWGDVVDIGLRRTQIRNTDGVIVNYPNAVLANSVITNFSHERQPVRVRVRFQVGYHADLDRARTVATRAIDTSEGVIPGTTEVLVRSLWDQARGHLLSGVLLEGRYRIADIADRTRIRSVVLEQLLGALRKEGIPLARFETHDSGLDRGADANREDLR